MTYEEFTTLAQRRISIDEYSEIVKPVYDYHPAIPNKKTAAKLYDMCGLQVFRDMKGTADWAPQSPCATLLSHTSITRDKTPAATHGSLYQAQARNISLAAFSAQELR